MMRIFRPSRKDSLVEHLVRTFVDELDKKSIATPIMAKVLVQFQNWAEEYLRLYPVTMTAEETDDEGPLVQLKGSDEWLTVNAPH